MKVKRLKTARRNLAFYRHHFGLRDPLQVLVDGNFCHMALQYKIHIKEQLPKTLSGVCKEQVTRCVMEELRRLGPDFSGALFIAKRFEMRRCSHKEPVAASECLASLVGDNNPNNYLVATQDQGLRARLRKAGSVPLIYLQFNMLLLEPPSRASILRAKQVEHQKLLPPPIEIKAAKRKVDPEGTDEAAAAKAVVHHRKRAKGPNPLSIRKPQKAAAAPKAQAPRPSGAPARAAPAAAAAAALAPVAVAAAAAAPAPLPSPAPAPAPTNVPAPVATSAAGKAKRRGRRGTRAGAHHNIKARALVAAAAATGGAADGHDNDGAL